MITNTIEIHQFNNERIRQVIRQQETFVKSDVARETRLSMATCSNAINEMVKTGEVIKIDTIGTGIGRPIDLFCYNRDFLHILAAYIYEEEGGIGIEFNTADALANIISSNKIFANQFSLKVFIAEMEKSMAADKLITCIGIGIPGVVSDDVIEFCDIKQLEQLNFYKILGEKFHADVTVKNDVNLITTYLYHLQSYEPENFAVIFFPKEGHHGYIGAGFMINGHILNGASMFSGEMYHVAEAFGISLADQHILMYDRAAFCRFIAQNLVTVCCTINPSSVVIISSDIEEGDIKAVEEYCLRFIQKRYMPEIGVINDSSGYASAGLIRQTLKNALFPMSLASATLL